MKNQLRTIFTHVVLIFLAMAMSACGGGGGGSSSDPTVSQGRFVDAAVEGITYTSGGQTGLTDVNGTFSYETGQPVTFSIGGITIGTVTGSAIITPVQLVNNATDETDLVVTNIVQFLLTVDADHNSANGIQITQAIRDAAVGLNVNFNNANFDFDGEVAVAVNALTTALEVTYL